MINGVIEKGIRMIKTSVYRGVISIYTIFFPRE